ncbi:leucine-rich repeat domain-containing protein [Flammeovirga aprica]|uniref:Ig-like domain-containing protein n=1 Tax=Flammeovirga aprica JL-4 TaxID=694437 RepID=A0A7X9RVV1_9BACT|nr:hypothetical protein [Flammeovirga aprica]NME69678.1 hypothetical protein [Flammeovirga aprica JL-4]
MKYTLFVIIVLLTYTQSSYGQNKTKDYWVLVAFYLDPENEEIRPYFDKYRSNGISSKTTENGWQEMGRLFKFKDITDENGFLKPMEELPEVPGGIDNYDFVSKLGFRRYTNSTKDLSKQRVLKFNLSNFKLPPHSIKTLPQNFGDMDRLVMINIFPGGGLTELPQSFEQLKRLEFINLRENLFQRFPSQITKNSYSESVIKDDNGNSTLVYLNLSGNKIKYIPYDFFEDFYIRDECVLDNNALDIYELKKIKPSQNLSLRRINISNQKVIKNLTFCNALDTALIALPFDLSIQFDWILDSNSKSPLSCDKENNTVSFAEEGKYTCKVVVPDLKIKNYLYYEYRCKVIPINKDINALELMSLRNTGKLNWSQKIPLEHWEGVDFDESFNALTIDVSRKNLNFLVDLSKLKHLEKINLTYNPLTTSQFKKLKIPTSKIIW